MEFIFTSFNHHERCLFTETKCMYKTCKTSNQMKENPAQKWPSMHKVPPLIKKLFSIDSCWEREKSSFFNEVGQEELTSP